jgi:hypothetical protein
MAFVRLDAFDQSTKETDMGSVDGNGNRLLDSGVWNGATTVTEQGGQLMNFQLTNQNILGTTITISADTGESHDLIIGPQGVGDMSFSIFGGEPRTWTFSIDTNSDAFVVSWALFSTWIPGDPPNP